MKKILFLLFFIPLFSFGQHTENVPWIFNKYVKLQDSLLMNNISESSTDTSIYEILTRNINSKKIQQISVNKITCASGKDSIFVSYCSGCAMTTGWKLNGDTLRIDTSYVNKIIKDSLSNHYDLITDLDTGKVSTSGDIMYGDLHINSNLDLNGSMFISNAPLGTAIDSVLMIENGQLKSVDGSSFKPDSTSSGCFNNFYYKQITGCDVNNLYIKADTTKFSNYIKLPKFANNTTEPVLKVLASGRIDTNQTRSIMGLYLDSLDVGEIDLTTLNVTTANITTANIVTSIEQNLVLPNLWSNNKPVLTVKDSSGVIDTTQVKSIYEVDFDSLKITNYVVIGGVPNVDYKFTLADDGIYTFANSSYGFGNLYSFNAGKKTAFTNYSFDNDGVIYFETSTPLVVNSATDGYEICLYYSGGTYYIKNTSGGARNYILSIKYY